MRLPFISRRRHETAVDFLAAIQKSNLNDALDEAYSERMARLLAEAELRRERAAMSRLKAYMVLTHTARYEKRIGRLRRAVAAERAQAAAYRRTITRLTDQLLDATGYQGEPLIPAARVVLGIEDAKEES
ncbi:hypothetical protein ACI2LJ_27610 [Streptomyces sp. NPDC088090]|uniref:hypothetical protein n=1 Tax=Streptomyces sp. NPDC088090 TaxID=3365822 RepID=UPI00384FA5BE